MKQSYSEIGRKPLAFGENSSSIFTEKGFKGPRGQGTKNTLERLSLKPLNPCILGPSDYRL
jgi:hypothetical protein